MSPPTFAERFDLGGLAGRVGFNEGSSMARPGNIAYTFRKTPPNIIKLKQLLDNLKTGDSFTISDLAKQSGATRKTVGVYLKRDYPHLGSGEGTQIQREELGKRTTAAADVEHKKLLEKGYLKDYKNKIVLARGSADKSLSNEALAKKYFPNLSKVAAIGRIEKANARIRKEFPNLTYKKVDPNKTYLERKEKIQKAEKYSSKADLQDVNAIKNKKEYLNKYFKDNPNAINDTEFGKKIKNQMDIRINDKGEIYLNKRPDKYYIEKATSKNGIFSIFDVNAVKTGERFLRVSDNLNLSTKQFNEAFIEGQVNRFFKKDGKLHNNKDALNKVIKILNKYNIRVKIDDVGRIGEHEKVAATGKENRIYPRVTKSLEILGLPETLTSFSENVSASNRTKPQIFARKILDTGQKAWSKLPFKNLRILPSGALAATDFTIMSLLGVPFPTAAVGASSWLSKSQVGARAAGTQAQAMSFMDEINQKKAEENLAAAERLKIVQKTAQDIKPFELEEKKEGGLSGVDQYIINRGI